MLEFKFWDVEHGHATYIRTPNNRHMVVDLGVGSFSTKHEFSPLLHLRSNYGVNRLDYVVITHPHRDHIDDIENFDGMNPLTLMRPRHLTAQDIRAGNRPGDSAKVDKYLEIDARYQTTVTGTTGDAYDMNNWGGVKIAFFLSPSCNRKNLNNHSIVTTFEYLGMKVILPGDNERESWLELLKDQSFLNATKDAEVILAPHHGREAGYCSELLDHVRPRLVVISDGPEGTTSCTEKYATKIRQWRGSGAKVSYRNGSWNERFCVTTRCDGMVTLQLGTYQEQPKWKVIAFNGTGANR